MNPVHIAVRLAVPLVLLSLVAITNSEPKMLTELKYRYFKTLDILRETKDPIWKPVLKPAIITGLNGKKDGIWEHYNEDGTLEKRIHHSSD